MLTQRPVLDFGENAESALLGTKTVKLVVADLRVEAKAEVKLDLAPVPGVYLYGEFKDPRLPREMMSALVEPESLTVVDSDNQLMEGVSAGSKWSADGTVKLKWLLLGEPLKVVGDDETQMTQLVAHVFNFETRLWRRSTETIGLLELKHGPWKGRLRWVNEGGDQTGGSRGEGSYRVTHLLEAGQGGNDFSGKEADDLLHAMRHFLTFAKEEGAIWHARRVGMIQAKRCGHDGPRPDGGREYR